MPFPVLVQGVFIHFHGQGQEWTRWTFRLMDEWTGSKTSPAVRVHPVHKDASICVHDVHRVHRVPVH